MFGVLLLILLQKMTFLKHNILLKSSCFLQVRYLSFFGHGENILQNARQGETNLEVSTIVVITTWP